MEFDRTRLPPKETPPQTKEQLLEEWVWNAVSFLFQVGTPACVEVAQKGLEILREMEKEHDTNPS